MLYPMESDEFKAIRFSLRGSVEALDLMRAAAEKLQQFSSKKPHSEAKPAAEKL